MSRPISALVLDDRDLQRQEVVAMLLEAGLAAFGSTEDLHGVVEAQRQQPDVILVGAAPDSASQVLHLCRCIRADPQLAHTPMLMLVEAGVSAEERAEALVAGINGYLLEPVHPRELLAYVGLLVQARWPAEPHETALLPPEALPKPVGMSRTSSEVSTFLQRLARQLRTGHEEQRRLARDLAEGLGQELAALKMEISLLRRQVERQNVLEAEHLLTALASTLTSVDNAVEILRRLVKDLPAESVETKTVVQVAESYVADFRRRTGLRCKLTVNNLGAVPKTAEVWALLTVLREALAVVAPDASPRQALTVHLEALGDEWIELRISDREGRLGKALEHVESCTSSLQEAVERVVALGGHVEPVRRCGPGSMVSVVMPFPSAQQPKRKRP